MSREVNSREWVWNGLIWVKRKATDEGEAYAALKAYDGSQWRDLRVQSGDYANLRVSIYDANSLVESIDGNSDAKAATKIGLASGAYQFQFNGESWDRVRGTYSFVALARATRSGTPPWAISSPAITIFNAKGLHVCYRFYSWTTGASPEWYWYIDFRDEINDGNFRQVLRPSSNRTDTPSHLYIEIGQGVGSLSGVGVESPRYYAPMIPTRIMFFALYVVSDVTEVEFEIRVSVLN